MFIPVPTVGRMAQTTIWPMSKGGGLLNGPTSGLFGFPLCCNLISLSLSGPSLFCPVWHVLTESPSGRPDVSSWTGQEVQGLVFLCWWVYLTMCLRNFNRTGFVLTSRRRGLVKEWWKRWWIN